MQHKSLVLPAVDALRSVVLDAKRRAGFTVLLLPLTWVIEPAPAPPPG